MSATATATAFNTASNSATTAAPTVPSDISTYRAVHAAIRRAPHRLAEAALELRPGEHPRLGAFAHYWEGYAHEVLLHHRTEDDIFFPALVEAIPEARTLIERTDDEHHELDRLMEMCHLAVQDLARDAGRPHRERAAEALRAFAAHMDGHLDFEDDQILPLFAERFDGDRFHELEQVAVKSVGVGMQAAFAIPFVMSGISSQARTELLEHAPLPPKVLYRLTRRRHRRLEELVFGRTANEQAVADLERDGARS